MLISLFPIILATLPSVLGGQVPIVDGVLGGVRNTNASSSGTVKPADLSVAATTPGKIRAVENTGICGELSRAIIPCPSFNLFPPAETTPGVYSASGYGDLTSTESLLYVDIQLEFIFLTLFIIASGISQPERTMTLPPSHSGLTEV